jgi:predicted transporter
MRGTIAKAMIGLAVLVPALIIVAVAVSSKMQLMGLQIRNLTPWIIADTVLLGFGLLLHKGEDL